MYSQDGTVGPTKTLMGFRGVGGEIGGEPIWHFRPPPLPAFPYTDRAGRRLGTERTRILQCVT